MVEATTIRDTTKEKAQDLYDKTMKTWLEKIEAAAQLAAQAAA
jgi:hypothetical protein